LPDLEISTTRSVLRRALRSAGRTRTLESAYEGRRNSLGLLRLVFASLVVFSHAWPSSGHGLDPLWRWSGGREGLGGIGVAGFFVISGFLVTRSGYRLSVPRYFWHRVLRIFPAFLVCLVFTAFVLAPALWLYEYGSLTGFFTHEHGPVDYVASNWLLTISQWDVSGLPANVPYNETAGVPIFDGPLWTLQYEFACYLLIGVLLLLGLRRAGKWVLPSLLVATWTTILVVRPNGSVSNVFWGPLPLVGGWVNPYYLEGLGLLFLLGAALAVHARRIPINDALAVACGLVVVGTLLAGGYYGVAGRPALGYVVLWAGVRLPEWTRAVGSRRDYSYGIYIYAFLVQQTLAEIGVRNLGVHLVATFALTIPLAALSWHFIERPALSLKSMRLGRSRVAAPVVEHAANAP
jgi:peptidoglycan/LPS O-acetylase OafA/YrhL